MNFEDYIYLKKSHIKNLKSYSKELERLYGKEIDLLSGSMKYSQDSLVVKFICENIPPGSKILDVGGAYSRILSHFHPKGYECWLIDSFEGLGNGTVAIPVRPYKIIVGYMGDFIKELPDQYFDFVFSISALEHSPWEDEYSQRIIDDINRVLKPGGMSLHCLDSFLKPDYLNIHPFIRKAFDSGLVLGSLPNYADIATDEDTFFTSRQDIEHWMQVSNSGLTVEEFIRTYGKPFTIQVLWQKPIDTQNTLSGF